MFEDQRLNKDKRKEEVKETVKPIEKKIEVEEDVSLSKLEEQNFIAAEINVKEEDINKNMHIYYDYAEKCKIEANGHIKLSSSKFSFKEAGKYPIKYYFSNKLTSTKNMFDGCDSLISIDLSNLNTQNLYIMKNMFYGCNSLSSINFTNINTENVEDMTGLFSECSSLTSVNLSNFNTKNVINMSWMFDGCVSLKSIDVSKFDTKKVKEMQ